MSSVVISGDTSGAITLQAPAVSGNTTLNLPASSGTVLTQNSSAPANSFVVDASGNVGIGTGSPASKLTVGANPPTAGALAAVASSAGGVSLSISDNVRSSIYVNHPAGGLATFNTDPGGAMAFATNGTTERMRIDSSGNVGINTNETSIFTGVAGVSKLVVTGNNSATTVANNQDACIVIANTDDTANNLAALHFAWQDSDNSPNFAAASIVGILGTKVAGQYPAGQIAFLTSSATNNAPSEKMRIDSSGNLLIGRTNNPSGFTSGLYVTGAYSTTTPSGANVFINTDGSFFRSTSSIKYKTNVENYAKGLDDLSKLRPVTYQAKEGINTEQVFAGFVAEEVHEVGLTEFVQYAEDGTPDALSYGNMVALCVKAIQELKAIVDEQAEKIKALEAK